MPSSLAHATNRPNDLRAWSNGTRGRPENLLSHKDNGINNLDLSDTPRTQETPYTPAGAVSRTRPRPSLVPSTPYVKVLSHQPGVISDEILEKRTPQGGQGGVNLGGSHSLGPSRPRPPPSTLGGRSPVLGRLRPTTAHPALVSGTVRRFLLTSGSKCLTLSDT